MTFVYRVLKLEDVASKWCVEIGTYRDTLSDAWPPHLFNSIGVVKIMVFKIFRRSMNQHSMQFDSVYKYISRKSFSYKSGDVIGCNETIVSSSDVGVK